MWNVGGLADRGAFDTAVGEAIVAARKGAVAKAGAIRAVASRRFICLRSWGVVPDEKAPRWVVS